MIKLLRKAFQLLFVLLTVAFAEVSQTQNYVLFIADNLGYGSIGVNGADPEMVVTPNLDALAK